MYLVVLQMTLWADGLEVHAINMQQRTIHEFALLQLPGSSSDVTLLHEAQMLEVMYEIHGFTPLTDATEANLSCRDSCEH